MTTKKRKSMQYLNCAISSVGKIIKSVTAAFENYLTSWSFQDLEWYMLLWIIVLLMTTTYHI